MRPAPIPTNDEARLKALKDIEILGSDEESTFDDITRLAAMLCGTKMALVTFIDKDVQWLKSGRGQFPATLPRSMSLCGHAIAQADHTHVFEIPDVRRDERFGDNPVLREANVGFYAGATLLAADGHALGTLCVLDHAPKALTADQKVILQALAKHVVNLLDFRQQRLRSEAATAKLGQLLNHMVEGLILQDATGRVIQYNMRAMEILGVNDAQLNGKNPSPTRWEVLSEDGATLPRSEFPAMVVMRTGKPQIGVILGLRVNDTPTKWFSVNSSPVIDQVGQAPTRVISTFSDITGSHFKRSEGSTFFEMSLDPMCIASKADYITRFNTSFDKLLGYPREELMSQPFTNFVHADDRQQVTQALAQLGDGCQAVHFTCRCLTVTGGCVTLSWSLSVDPQTNMHYATVRDVTLQSTLQRKLEDAQTIAKLGSWEYEVATGDVTWTRQMHEIFPLDLSKGPPTFERHVAALHPDDQTNFRATVAHAMMSGAPYSMVFRCIKNETTHWFEARGHGVRDSQGKIATLYGTCQDISQRILLEQDAQLSRAKTIHNAKLASLGEMAGGVAHEINNPLAIIAGNTDQIRRILERPTPDLERVAAKIKVIHTTTDRIARIIKGLRNFSRNADNDPKTVSSSEALINDAVALCGERFRINGVDLRVQITPNLHGFCRPTELSQVILNLLTNAYDAVIECNEKWIVVESIGRGNNLVIAVTDSGRGIPAPVAERMMEPFFTTKGVGKGTGLGLSIAKGIVEEHGGALVYDTASENTRFIIELPLVDRLALVVGGDQ